MDLAHPDTSLLIAKYSLLALLTAIAIVFAVAWYGSLRRKVSEGLMPSPIQLVIGFITDFLDTLGVGSFATTTSLYKFSNQFPAYTKPIADEKIPGTLNVGHTLPTILQALIYINTIEIDLWTLWLLIIASGVGSYLGASFVTRLPKRKVQLGMGFALLVAVTLLLAKLLKYIPEGGESMGLTGMSLIIGLVGNFIFGASMTIGIGAYAPIMIMVSLLGMNQKAAFPLMMGSCAFLMPVASYRFVKTGKYDPRGALGLTLLGLPAVAIAAFIVKELPLEAVNWLVVAVVIVTAISLLVSAARSTDAPPDPPASEAATRDNPPTHP
jgi:uncharacterized membrane protein YfcA